MNGLGYADLSRVFSLLGDVRTGLGPEDLRALWAFLTPGFLLTVAVETPVLLLGLSRPHSWRRRLAAGLWLNACSYPIVVLVFPVLVDPRWYIWVAEIFAPVCECAMFSLAFHRADIRWPCRIQDWVTITFANLASFLTGVWLENLHYL